jgi:PAS domain S-box-containing protein
MSDTQQRILGTILSNLPALLALKDKKLTYTVVNPRFCQLLGKTPPEIAGKTDADLFQAEEAGACAKEDQSVLKSGMARSSEIQLTGKDGAHWFDVMRAPILDENGDPAGIMFAAYDVTEFKHREVAVQGAEARIAEAVQRADALQATMDEHATAAAQAQAHVAEQRAAVEALLAEKAALQDQLIEAQSAASTAAQEAAQLAQGATQAREAAAAAQAELQASVAALTEKLDAAEAQANAAQEGLRQQLKAAEEERTQLDARLQQASATHAQAGQLAQTLANLLQS